MKFYLNKIVCKVFGHTPEYGYANSPNEGYLKLYPYTVDGLGKTHVQIFSNCQRCNTEYKIGNLNLGNLNLSNK